MDEWRESESATRSVDAGEILWNVLQEFVGSADLTVDRTLELRTTLRAARVGDDVPFLEHLQLLWTQVWSRLPEFARPIDPSETKRLWFTA